MYGTIRMHQEREYPGRVVGTTLVNPDFAAYARSFGADGYTVEATADFAPAFAPALASQQAGRDRAQDRSRGADRAPDAVRRSAPLRAPAADAAERLGGIWPGCSARQTSAPSTNVK